MTRIALVLAAACTATAPAQSPDARTVLQTAAEAMRSLQSLSYDARLETRGGTSWRVVDGRVLLDRIDADGSSDPVGGRILVEGEITRSGRAEAEAFKAAYDGVWMRRLRPESQMLLEGQPGYGGEELLRGSFGELILDEFFVPETLVETWGDHDLRWLRREQVGSVDCDVVEIRHRDDDGTEQWWLGADDGLPRKMRRQFLSARGTEVESELVLSNLEVDTEIDSDVFRLVPPESFTVDIVGRQPPRETKIGDRAPEWTLKGPDGKIHRLQDYRGKLVVLDFWASWCPHCNAAMPAIQRMHDEYADRGVEFLALNCRDRGDVDPVAYIRNKGYTYFVADGNETAVRYRVGGLPSFYVIGPDGRLVHRQTGYSPEREKALIEVIERNLPETSG
jgi:thiol-disulfide isomerase/thioredoxin